MDRVVIVGGVGFIGRGVLDLLVAQVRDLVVIDNLCSSISRAAERYSGVRFLKTDITDFPLKEAPSLRNAVWIHLAALPFVPDAALQPEHAIRTNVVGSLRASRVAHASQCERFIHISSSEVYGAARDKVLTEQSDTRPRSVYAVSKLAAEGVVREQSELPWVILRLFNAYGPDATHPYFIPDMIRQCLKTKEIRVGNLDRMRDFTHVQDTASAIFKAIKTVGLEHHILNVSSGRPWSMREVLRKIQEGCDASQKKVIVDQSRMRPVESDPELLVGDSTKARSLLDWAPMVPLESGIERTIATYQNVGEWPYEQISKG
jgi:nucleoside-diphosphate-sugar epimerase